MSDVVEGETRTKGVSLGPHIKASQVKKSDSEMGPVVTRRGEGGGGGRRAGNAPAVNMPSGEP